MKKGDQPGQDVGEAAGSAAPAVDPKTNPTAAKADAEQIDLGKTVDPKTEKDAYPDPAYESGGPKGLEPTRYGDWERKGTISDF
jgi:hypothetical protein